jgi:2-succinyl-6-hydroxy-2,4-cyclohexadiene-1-carboxylate synthase
MWAEVAAMVGGEWEMPDLPGHGVDPAVGWAEAVASVVGRINASGPGLVLAGYSMGGRLALAAALEAPRPPRSLLLVSASPGIADGAARARRREDDEATARRIERLGVEVFVTEWLAGPMFSGLGRRPAAWGARDLRMRCTNDAAGLAGAIRLLGQGSQPYLGDRLDGLGTAMTAAAGERDEAYAGHARRMAGAVPRGRFVLVPGAGHAVVGEDPGAVASLLLG